MTSFYEHGPFGDLCKGPHVATTAAIGPFKLLSVAGAYWRGDEKRPMLQRIYGTVWETQDELDQFLWRREEAKKRDHRKLGLALDLFSFHDVSPGSAFWHPKGQRLWRTLEAAMRELQERRGYQEISTPMVVHEKLWRQSGHWDLYRDNMFLIESEGQTFSPQADELPGVDLHLQDPGPLVPRPAAAPLRVRAAPSQRTVRDALGPDPRSPLHPGRQPHLRPTGPAGRRDRGPPRRGPRRSTAWFGLEPQVKFGTKPDKALGDPALWERAEALIREALDRSGLVDRVKPKDGAFYAPKIDVHVEDALGRSWQTATFQVDLVMLPERFDLEYIDADGQPKRPMAIHRAVYGSLERFIGILIEHFAGAFPLWLAPVQAVVIPIADRHSGRRRAGDRAARRRPARRGRRLRRPDAEQDPPGPGAEGPLHARAR